MNSQLEKALTEYRNGEPIIPDYDFLAPDFEVENLKRIRQAITKSANLVLVQLFALGLWIEKLGNPFQENKKNHRTGLFLYQYFKDEPAALGHLAQVTPDNIDRVGPKARKIIIQIKSRPVDLGQVEITPGELWCTEPEIPYSPRYTPPLVLSPVLSPEEYVFGPDNTRDFDAFFIPELSATERVSYVAPSHHERPLKRARFSSDLE